jgi:hypothetical protein
MGNESSLLPSAEQLCSLDVAEDATTCEPESLSSQLPASEFTCSAFADFSSLELILAQPLVIGQKRFRPSTSSSDEVFGEDLGNGACYKRACVSL